MFRGGHHRTRHAVSRRRGRRRGAAPPGRLADRGRHRRPGRRRHHRRVADADHEEHVASSSRGRGGEQAGAGDRRHRRQLDPRGDRAVRARPSASAPTALLQVTPYYNRPTQDGLYRHFKAIARRCRCRSSSTTCPGGPRCDLLPETIARLAELASIVGIKEATGNLRARRRCIARVGDRLAVLSGDDATAFPLYALGGRGVISVVSNVAPGAMARCGTPPRPATGTKARELHYRLLPLIEVLFVEANPIPVKAALAMMGGSPTRSGRRSTPGGPNRDEAAGAARRARAGVAVAPDSGRRARGRRAHGAGHPAPRSPTTRPHASWWRRVGARATRRSAGTRAAAGAEPPACRSGELPGAASADVWIDFTAASVTERSRRRAAALARW